MKLKHVFDRSPYGVLPRPAATPQRLLTAARWWPPVRRTPSGVGPLTGTAVPQLTRALRIAVGAVSAGAASGTLMACAAVTTVEGERLRLTSDRFADYAERVFRDQNRVATELAFALEDTPPESDLLERLESAEEALLEACAGLNELAAARRDEGRVGTGRQLAAARQAPACEQAVIEAAAVLDRVQ